MKALVTGGAGFIGSHFTDSLIKSGWEVVILDNLSTGQEVFIKSALESGKAEFVKEDVLSFDTLKNKMKGVQLVGHFQANADVRGGIRNTKVDLEQNVQGTFNVLESMRINEVPKIVFASSATVYGDPETFPTPEDNELIQTSVYGASKLAGEAYIQAFGEYFGIESHIFRFVSFIGERYTHGVIFDFMKKLRGNTHELEILGDGKQRKSYLHVNDGVQAMRMALENPSSKKNIYNLGHNDFMNVVDVAKIICDEMSLSNVEYRFTGGERGWLGDSPFVHLKTEKIQKVGWKPSVSIEEGIRRTVRYLNDHPYLFERRD